MSTGDNGSNIVNRLKGDELSSLELVVVHWNSLEFIGTRWSSLELVGVHWNSLEFIGTRWSLLELLRSADHGAARKSSGEIRNLGSVRGPWSGDLYGSRSSWNSGVI